MAEKIGISVIIPTYNRLKKLKLCLEALAKQIIDQHQFEVIVVNDGSNDPGSYRFRSWIGEAGKRILDVKYLSQLHKGPAAARNLGIKKARGKIILFLGDDVIASKNLLKIHLEAHKDHPADNIAILGSVSWHPGLNITPFMEWLESSGMQANYQSLKDNQQTSFKHFYTTNISLKRDFLAKFGLFDEGFKYPIFEDTELGYRLSKKGLKIIYEAGAKAFHLHQQDLKNFLVKMKLAGKVGRLLYEKHPELKDKIFPTSLPLKEILRLKVWQLLYPVGKLINNKKILFQNYQCLINQTLIKSFTDDTF